MANQIFCFQIKRTPWMAQFMAQFFPDCVIRVHSFCSTLSKFFINQHGEIFSCILSTGNQMNFLVQFGINKHSSIFSKTTNCTRPTGSCNFVSLWKIYSRLFIPNCTRNHLITYTNNIHEKISPCWLAESMPINTKQCKSLKFFERRKTKLVQKVEIEWKKLNWLNWLTGKSRKKNSQMANQIFCFQIKRTPWMAQFMAQFFPDCVIRVRSFCSTISKFFHQSARRNFSFILLTGNDFSRAIWNK